MLDIEIQRVENELDLGTPDLYFSHFTTCGWIELKQFKLPKREKTEITIPFRPGQYGWIRRFSRAGTRVILICYTNNGVFAFEGERIKTVYYGIEDFLDKASFWRKEVDHELRDWLVGELI